MLLTILVLIVGGLSIRAIARMGRPRLPAYLDDRADWIKRQTFGGREGLYRR